MNANVIIKSFSKGLKIILSSECSFEVLLAEIEDKFNASKSFFKGGHIAVSFEGRNLSKEEEQQIISVMESAGSLSVLYIVGVDDATNEMFAKAIDRPFHESTKSVVGKIYTGNVKKGMIVESDSGVIIVGDIEPGSKVLANGNIIVIGGIYGSAIVTAEDSEDYFIAANDMSAEKLQIGIYHNFSKEKAKWVVKPKMVSKIAYVDNHQVIIDPVSKETVNNLIAKLSVE